MLRGKINQWHEKRKEKSDMQDKDNCLQVWQELDEEDVDQDSDEDDAKIQ